MDHLLGEFKSETKKLVADMLEILEGIEEDFSSRKQLEEYGLFVDRIMGGAKSLDANLAKGGDDRLEKIGNYAGICKLVAYRGANIESNQDFYFIVVGLLMDATEVLATIIKDLNTDNEKDILEVLGATFIDRLKLVNQQFDLHSRGITEIQEDQGPQKATQEEIDALIAALG